MVSAELSIASWSPVPQNNLQELWSLLNFILPDVFSNVEDFNEWFDFAGVLDTEDGHVRRCGGGCGGVRWRRSHDASFPSQEVTAMEQRSKIVSKLQSILRPFMLRRIKTDVLTSLPQKKEASKASASGYAYIKGGRPCLMLARFLSLQIVLYAPATKVQRQMIQGLRDRTLQHELAELARGVPGARTTLNNMLMQMRKACNHPDLITGELDGSVSFPTVQELRDQCGKFQLLDRRGDRGRGSSRHPPLRTHSGTTTPAGSSRSCRSRATRSWSSARWRACWTCWSTTWPSKGWRCGGWTAARRGRTASATSRSSTRIQRSRREGRAGLEAPLLPP